MEATATEQAFAVHRGDWQERKHPRDQRGRFAAVDGHHVPGTPYNWRHGWEPVSRSWDWGQDGLTRADWIEGKHPRAGDGKFARVAGSSRPDGLLSWEDRDRLLGEWFHPVQLDASRQPHPKTGYGIKVGLERRVAQPPPGPANDGAGEGPAVFNVRDYGTLDNPAGTLGLGADKGQEPIPHVYRGMSVAEWEQAQERGYIDSDRRGVIAGWEGTNASAEPAAAWSYLPFSGDGVIAKIKVRPQDGWFTIIPDDYIRTRARIPLDLVEKVSPVLRKDEDGATRLVSRADWSETEHPRNPHGEFAHIAAEPGRSVLAGRDSLAAHTGPDGKLDPQRQALHEQIVAGILAGHQPQDHPQALFLGGGPASGKTTVMRNPPPDAAQIAADDIKALLPEYKAMVAGHDRMAGEFVQEESKALKERVLAEAARRRVNILLDSTGDTSYALMAGEIAKAHRSGYRVTGRYVTVDTDEAVRRSAARAKTSGRMVPEATIRAMHAAVSDIFARLIADDLYDSAQLWDNNVPRGAAARLVGEKKPGGTWRVTDSGAWARFAAKGHGGG